MSGTDQDLVRLEVPAALEHLRLARLVVAGALSQRDASFDEIEDLRLAVGEACAHLIDVAPTDGRLRLELTVQDHAVVVVVCGPCAEGTEGPDELAAALLSSVTDDHGTVDDGGERTVWFRRRIAVETTGR